MKSLIPFIFEDKFRMSFDNSLMFAGRLEESNGISILGKQVYIPTTEKHPAFTLKISSKSLWTTDLFAFGIKFNTPEEREVVAACDFTNDIFYIER